MRFHPTAIPGIVTIELEPREDERGYFARTYCRSEFEKHGIRFVPVQTSVSFNRVSGTVRGLHYQAAPRPEAKVVTCLRGRIFDVAADLRSGSSTYGRWVGLELTEDNRRALYVPEGVAHGFQTLDDGCLVSYMISEPFQPELARGVRWDDPDLGVEWPIRNPSAISERDRLFPLLREIDPGPNPGVP